MIRSSILSAIKEAMPEEVQHVDLWNHNVEFIEEEEAWSRPAVFVEFGQMDLQPVKPDTYRCRAEIRLHVVSDYDLNDPEGVFELDDKVAAAMVGLNGDGFAVNYLQSISTNHNHEDLIEEILAFSYSAEVKISD